MIDPKGDQRMRALILAPFSASQLALLRRRIVVDYESWTETRRLFSGEELAFRLVGEGVAILVIESDFAFEEVFEGAPDLQFLGICRNSIQHVDIAAATARSVLVVNTPGRNAQAVAEHALGLMLSLARRIPAAHRYVADGKWSSPVEPYLKMRGVELAGRTLGIIGLGAIGRRLASMASALGMTCIGYDPYVPQAPAGTRMTELDSLLGESDFIAIHAPLTPETDGMIDGRRIGMMKPTAYLVNLSDASIVAEEPLVSALQDRNFAGAALDVFETHPVAPSSPLLALGNVVLTPHLGGATAETIERHSIMMADDIIRYLDGRRPKHLVNPEVWEHGG